jgi:hypothetical protein
MLAHVLAMVVGLSSFSLYIAAFFFPEVHRKHDFAWSGLGMFYALVLWVCAGRITGGVLLGQTASVTLLGWLGWQMLGLRRSLTPIAQQTPLPGNARTIGEAIQLKMQDLRSRSGNLRLPAGFNRFLRQSGNWLSQATPWIQSKLSGFQKPKRRSVKARPPVQPVSVPLPTSSDQELETALVEEIAEAVETLPEETLPKERLMDETLLDEIDQVERTIEPEAVLPDAPSVEVLSTEVMPMEVVEPAIQPPVPSVNRPIAKSRSRQQNNFLTNVRNRVQSTLNSLGQRDIKPAATNLNSLDLSLDDLDDQDFEGESIELEITTAVLEEKIAERRAGQDQVEEIVVVEIIEDTVAAENTTVVEDIVVVENTAVVEDTVEVPEDAVEVDRTEVILATEPPLSDDIDPENPQFMSVPDAAIEAEINWEAVIAPEMSDSTQDEPDSTPSHPINSSSVASLDSIAEAIPSSNPLQP